MSKADRLSPAASKCCNSFAAQAQPLPKEDDARHPAAHRPTDTQSSVFLFWLVTEAKRKKSRHIRLGNDARISFESETDTHGRYLHMDVSASSEFWWDSKKSNQANLWESWIELGEKFYEAVTLSSVPVDLRALRALKRSPLALDLYAWLTYTAFVATKMRKSRVVPWEGLHAQMGAEYAALRMFRVNVRLALKKIQLVYPELKLDLTADGMTIHPSRTAIPEKS
jgi:hypothetical protein